MDTVIKVENLSKAYQLGTFSTGTLSKDIERWWALFRGREDPFLKIGETNDRSVKGKSDIVWSLKDINFSVGQGATLGVIGKNGAGKSTLLKLLSRVTSPTTGSVKLKGRVASLLEVGTGFHPELTGKENIYLNGAILGMRKAEITRKLDEIVDFSGVERYLNTPVKRYSSGMYVRLAFAVAAHLESEILIVDEVLAVGDAEFQKKCLGKMGEISKGQGRTILFVSHNMAAVSQLCDESLILKNGQIQFSGRTAEGIEKYLKDESGSNYFYSASAEKRNSENTYISDQYLRNSKGEQVNSFGTDDPITLVTRLIINKYDPNYTLGISLKSASKGRIFTVQRRFSELDMKGKDSVTVEFTVPSNTVTPGGYFWQTAIHIPNVQLVDIIDDTCELIITDVGSDFSIYEGGDYGCVFLNDYSLSVN